jgi:hypothetical protein
MALASKEEGTVTGFPEPETRGSDGSFPFRLKPHGDPDWRKGV